MTDLPPITIKFAWGTGKDTSGTVYDTEALAREAAPYIAAGCGDLMRLYVNEAGRIVHTEQVQR